MSMIRSSVCAAAVVLGLASTTFAQAPAARPPVETPTDVKPGSITCEECPYPFPSSYLPLTL